MRMAASARRRSGAACSDRLLRLTLAGCPSRLTAQCAATRLSSLANRGSPGLPAASPAFVLAQAFAAHGVRVAPYVRLQQPSAPGLLLVRWLLRTSSSSLVDGADTAALLLAAGLNLANGEADGVRWRRHSAGSPGQRDSRCGVGRRDCWRSEGGV
jgi:hypothetical protein